MTILNEGEPINDKLKEHAKAAPDWEYQETAGALYEWTERFNTAFELGLHTPVIRLERLPAPTFGSYHVGRNSFGVRHEIVINAKHLDRPFAQVLATLLHELLHEWQGLYGNAGKSAHYNYHNQQFCSKAKLYGLVVDQRGYYLGIRPGRFSALLAEHGVDIGPLRAPEEGPPPRRPKGFSKLRKFQFGCRTRVRCAVDLAAHCDRCGGPFLEVL